MLINRYHLHLLHPSTKICSSSSLIFICSSSSFPLAAHKIDVNLCCLPGPLDSPSESRLLSPRHRSPPPPCKELDQRRREKGLLFGLQIRPDRATIRIHNTTRSDKQSGSFLGENLAIWSPIWTFFEPLSL